MFAFPGLRRQHFTLFSVIVVVVLTAPPSATATHPRLARLPRLVLWAWERPEDLRALGRDVGVAFLAQTINARDGGLLVEPRRQPLRVSPSTPLVAVTRIEAGRALTRPLTSEDASQMASSIARTATLRQVVGVQIDFDATLSQRDFYRELVADLRIRVASDTPISMTALASWCADDRWVQTLHTDEVVPMLFRMGPTNEPYREIGATGRWNAAVCRNAIGASLDEPLALAQKSRRLYVFAPKSWTVNSVVAARRLGGGLR